MDQLDQTLRQESSRAGLLLPEGTLVALHRFVSLLVRWGRRLNLTARPEPVILVQRHLADAFFLAARLAPLTPHHGHGSLIDAGSGAGLPGILMPILIPGLRLTLVEARERKCAFLRTACHELGLEATILAGRLEHLSLPPHDLACSRATWPPAEWLQRAQLLVKPGGLVVAFLSDSAPAPEAPPLLRQRERFAYTLGDGTSRALLLLQRLP